jgi:hypothetical protein
MEIKKGKMYYLTTVKGNVLIVGMDKDGVFQGVTESGTYLPIISEHELTEARSQ